MKSIFLAVAAGLVAFGCNENSKKIEWISTTENQAWQVRSMEKNMPVASSDQTIIIDPESKQQEVDGFGGCFNELGWEALQVLEEQERQKILTDLFDPGEGCKFNICRMPIGANDYAVDWYSHNETPDDFRMENFSIDRDRKRLIPYIKSALAYNPDLKIWASPWCPPSWMKENQHYACRPDVVNDLPESGQGEEMKVQFRMEDQYLSAYALYFSRFIHAYREEGIGIYAVHNQNEPNSCQNFPSCIWTPEAIATFIGDYLGPRFEADQLNTEIWFGTIERPQIDRIDPVLNHPRASRYIKGLGFQWAGKGAIPDVNQKYQDYKLMQTETECGNGSNDWAAARHTWDLMNHYFENGANSYMYWNMVLNETGKSQWGWKQNSMITIDSETRQVRYNPEFYLMKHFSYFVEPGAYKLSDQQDDFLAFRNSDSIVVIFYSGSNNQDLTLKIGADSYSLKPEANSFNTFKIYI